MLKRIGITGQAGFIGTHLFNFLNIQDDISLVSFQDDFFSDPEQLIQFVSSCDCIIHLAAMNRHNDSNELFGTNIDLVSKLIAAMEESKVSPNIIFSSSIQEDLDNPYGKSKKEGRKLFLEWAKKSGANFTGVIIPNVYGPFGHPYYNSVVATFSYQLTHNEIPKIDKDSNLKLIYVGELVEEIFKIIKKNIVSDELRLKITANLKVSEILRKLENYKNRYVDKGIFPKLDTIFDRNLFNTFRCYIDHKAFFPFKLVRHSDNRGTFVETIRSELGGQVSFSTTKPGITRGNHFHTRKIERFAVIKGKARIELRRIGTQEILSFDLDGNVPSFVDMPIWFTHNITNTGDEELFTVFWINEFFDPVDTDTYFENV